MKLTIGKINLWRLHVRLATEQPWGMFTRFRKPC